MRWGLISVYLLGALLAVYGVTVEPARTARLTLAVAGMVMVAVAAGMDQLARARLAKSQPYTTTDWLRGRRVPGGTTQSRVYFLINLLVGCGWAAKLVFSDNPGLRYRLGVFILIGYVALGGIGIFQKLGSSNEPATPRASTPLP